MFSGALEHLEHRGGDGLLERLAFHQARVVHEMDRGDVLGLEELRRDAEKDAIDHQLPERVVPHLGNDEIDHRP